MRGIVCLVVVAVSAAAHAQCTKDTECKGDRICIKGVCEAPGTAPTASPATSSQPAAVASTEADVVAKYVAGDGAGARADAARAGFTSLGDKLNALETAYSAGASARDAKQVDVAIGHYEEALRLDATITREAGKYRRAIHRALSKLYADRAEEKFSVSDLPAARVALTTALEHNPENAAARAKLDELNAATRPVGAAMLGERTAGASKRRVALLDEKEKLLADMPSLAPPIVAVIVTVAVASVIVGLGSALLWSPIVIGVVIAVEVALCIIFGIVLGSNIAQRVRINRRVSDIERELERLSAAPSPRELPSLVVWRF